MRELGWLGATAAFRARRSLIFDDFAAGFASPNWDAETASKFVIRSNAASPAPAALTSYSLTPASTTVTEGNTSITFTITRSGDRPVETIYASTLFDTANAPGDYDGLVNLAVNFSLNQTSRTFTVSINEDSVVEATEHFRVMIGDDTSDGSAQALDISDVFITDDDAPAGTTYSLTPSSTTVTEGDTSITFTITRSGNISSSATIYASTLFDTASSPGDYDGLVNRVVSFAANDSTETFTVSINEDSLVEATEHFRVMIGDDTTDQSAQALDISDVYITDDDAPTGTTYSLTPSSTTVTEGNTSITFTITRSGNISSSATIYASTLFDTASSPGDYDGLVNRVVSFAANDSTETFTVSINEDSLVEATEHFRVMIGDDTTDQSAQALDISDIFITDNDGATIDTVREGTDTTTSIALNGSISGRIDAEPISGDGVTSDQQGGYIDKDWYRVTLERGHVYTFNADSTAVSTGAVAISLYNASGSSVRSVTEGGSPSFTYDTSGQSSASQTYYFAISAGGPEPTWRTATGNYTLGVSDGGTPPPPPADDFRDDQTDTTAPLGSLTVGSSINGYIGTADSNDSYGDKDVFQVNLTAGQIYDFRLRSTAVNGSSLPAGVFTIRDDNFNQLEISGSGSDEHEIFTAERTGTYYVRVGSGGTSSDTGGYRLEVNPVQASQVPDDWADNPNDSGVAGTLSPGSNRLGTIESSGDKDYFTVTLHAGKTYHFSVDAEDRSGVGAVGTLALSLRGPNSFNTRYQGFDDGSGGAGFDVEVTQTGTYYLRVGAGSDSDDTGGYRLSVSAGRTTPPPLTALPSPAPIPGVSALQQLDDFLDIAVRGGAASALGYFSKSEFWEGLETILKGVGHSDSLAASRLIFTKMSPLATVTDFTAHWIKINSEISKGADPVRVILVEMTDFVAGELIAKGGASLVVFLTAVGTGLAGPPGGAAGAAAGLIVAGGGIILYETHGSEYIKNFVGWAYDLVTDIFKLDTLDIRSFITSDEAFNDELPILPRLDSEFYLSTYPDANLALAQGTVGSALAHYLTIGIDLGYRPNATQLFTRGDIAFSIVNNDPAVMGSAALFTQPLGQLAGDGISSAEQSVASALAAAAGVSQGAMLDADLSALAHRKALDLAVNAPGDTIAAAGAVTSLWALQWSDGSDFAQAFAAELEALLGAGAPGTSYRLFVTASSNGSAADVLARFQAQEGWSGGGFDTFGIAEFGGHWVVIVADRASGVNAVTPGADTLTTASIYGSGESESLYGGMRAGRLFGLDGNDTLVSGVGQDYLDGGSGDDIYVINGAQDRVVELSGGGRDTIYSVVSYALAADAEIEVLLAYDYESTQAMNLTGNALGQHIQGNAGVNVLDGGAGSDILVAGAGNDVLKGGTGNDRLFGGAGLDTFVLASIADSTMFSYTPRSDGKKFFPDLIADFVTGEDKLDLSAIDAIAGTAANDAFTFIGYGAFSNQAGELRGYIENGMVQLVGDVDGDGLGDFRITVAATIYVTDMIL